MGLRAARAVAVLACLLGMGACGTDAPATHHAAVAKPSPPQLTEEPAAGVAVARHKLIDTPVGSGNGSLMITYEVRNRCYLRRIYPDGTVAGWFSADYCLGTEGTSTGFLGWDSEDPLHKSMDLSEPPTEIAIAPDDPGREPSAGDSAAGWCEDLYEEGGVPISAHDRAYGCAYSPKDHTFYRVGRDTMEIDAAGRVWSHQGKAIKVTDGSKHWEAEPFPADPAELLVSGGDSAAVWLEDRDYSMYVTSDAGRSWERVTGAPSGARYSARTAVLPDGRLLMGPDNGQFWRGEDPTNRGFESFSAGPLTTVVSAGKRLYGLADQSQDRSLHDLVWMSADGGSSWRKVLGADGAAPYAKPVPAEELQQPVSAATTQQIEQMAPTEVVVNADGLVLVGYGLRSKTGWRLYDRRDRIVAQGLDGHGGQPAGTGFLIFAGGGLKYVDPDGSLTPVEWREEERLFPVAAGDLWVPGYGVYRPSTQQVFDGAAPPDGKVTTVDGRGRMWALSHATHGRTVVRWGRPGGAWESRDLGPAIGATEVDGSGSTLIVTGDQDLYLSLDMGQTWRRATHGAVAYSGPPLFGMQPDGTLVGGDSRGTIRVSHDHGQTFQDGTIDQPRQLGGLYARGDDKNPEISHDGVHWFAFTPANARRLLG